MKLYNFSDIANELKIKLSTFRYWMKKNEKDFTSKIYGEDLSIYTENISVNKKVGKITRGYHCKKIKNKESFILAFKKYTAFYNNYRKRKREAEKMGLSWTRTAVECYFNGLNCTKCFNQQICQKILNYTGSIPMKNTVKKLLEVVGEPKAEDIYYILEKHPEFELTEENQDKYLLVREN